MSRCAKDTPRHAFSKLKDHYIRPSGQICRGPIYIPEQLACHIQLVYQATRALIRALRLIVLVETGAMPITPSPNILSYYEK
jgi:hypothetical protein